MEETARLPEAEAFRQPVDVNRVRSYCELISYPVDLGTILQRVRNRYYRYVVRCFRVQARHKSQCSNEYSDKLLMRSYLTMARRWPLTGSHLITCRRLDSLLFDLELMARNCERFNGRESSYSRECALVRAHLLGALQQTECFISRRAGNSALITVETAEGDKCNFGASSSFDRALIVSLYSETLSDVDVGGPEDAARAGTPPPAPAAAASPQMWLDDEIELVPTNQRMLEDSSDVNPSGRAAARRRPARHISDSDDELPSAAAAGSQSHTSAAHAAALTSSASSRSSSALLPTMTRLRSKTVVCVRMIDYSQQPFRRAQRSIRGRSAARTGVPRRQDRRAAHYRGCDARPVQDRAPRAPRRAHAHRHALGRLAKLRCWPTGRIRCGPS